MKIQPECITCFFRQALDAASLAGACRAEKEEIIKEFSRYLADCDFSQPPPVAGEALYKIIEKVTGKKDPFKELKEESNRFALEVASQIREKVFSSPQPLRAAVEAAIAGNIIDYGIKSAWDIEKEKEQLLKANLAPDLLRGTFAFDAFQQDVDKAKTVLYLADNAGEIVFDRILVEELIKLGKQVVVAVREGPIINDALYEDAETCGLTEIAEVVSSGVSTPGVVMEKTTPEFRRRLEAANLIISKGQGNFEALEGKDLGRPLYFLFRIKCEVIAEFTKEELGAIVLKPQAERAVLK